MIKPNMSTGRVCVAEGVSFGTVRNGGATTGGSRDFTVKRLC